MGSELAILLIRLGVLALLWLFVFAAIRAIRLDVFGPRVPKSKPAPAPKAQPAPRPKPQATPAKTKQKLPRHLVITEGSLAGQSVDLSEAPITIGRAPESTLVLTDDYASTHHARLVPQDGQWLIEDLGSTNGTYLDKAKVTRPTPVPPGSKVRIGKTVLELRR
jgi:pSer/pThr/pTyr-binding forkhead associated (FHA) protein